MSEDIETTAPEWSTAPLDREIVVTRVVDADCDTVCAAWTDPEQLPLWFGPDGFSCKTHEIDVRTGGIWRFDMIAPDGSAFSSRMEFVRVEAPHLIEVLHGTDEDNDPDRFRMRVSFDAQGNGKTVVTLRQLHPTPERREIVIGFGAVEMGGQTLAKLAAAVEGR